MNCASQCFGLGSLSSTSPFGPVENPCATGFSAGGSSSGLGALLASGAIDMGVGGDTSGSARIVCGESSQSES